LQQLHGFVTHCKNLQSLLRKVLSGENDLKTAKRTFIFIKYTTVLYEPYCVLFILTHADHSLSPEKSSSLKPQTSSQNKKQPFYTIVPRFEEVSYKQFDGM